jgi:hypothetical protein
MRFVRVRQGAGIVRDRYGLEGADLPSKVVEVRGGAVAMEEGALGGFFTGVTFISMVRACARVDPLAANQPTAIFACFPFLPAVYTTQATTPESVRDAIKSTIEGTGGRVYGGHVFVMDGDVDFVACNFWDTVLVLPLTDQVYLLLLLLISSLLSRSCSVYRFIVARLRLSSNFLPTPN